MNTQIDQWKFSGDGAFVANIDNDAAVDLSANYPDLTLQYGGVVRIPATDHGYLASGNIWGPKNDWLCVYVKGTDNYDGLRTVVAVATDTIDIIAPYTAETFAGGGAETLQPGFKFDHSVELIGFDLKLSSASATVENLTIVLDAAAGSAFDNVIYTLAMNTVQYSSINLEELSTTQRFIDAQDEVYFNWANSNGRTFGLTIHTRRRRR